MTKFLHSRTCIIVAAFFAAICAFVFYGVADAAFPTGDVGIVSDWSSPWVESKGLNLLFALALNMAAAWLMIFLCRRYNLLRSITMLPGALFIFMQLATPILMVYSSTALLLCVGIAVCMMLMFESFNNNASQRNIFLVFFILSLGAATDYAFAVYVPVFLLAIAQMRVLNLRSVLASLMGIATPWIILFGFGIVDTEQLQFPIFRRLSISYGSAEGITFIITALLTAFVGISAWVQNLMKVLTYNAHSRALLSVTSVTMFVTILATAVDFVHIFMFVPLLNFCVALQVGHLFGVIFTAKKSYIAILSIIGVYFIIYAIRLVICAL